LLFTEFQTVFAALYDDRLSVVFEGNYEGDTDTAEYLTGLTEHDYRVMQAFNKMVGVSGDVNNAVMTRPTL
jgi:hypothetical protein